MKTNLLKVCNEVALYDGVTYNLSTGESNPDYGYMVSLSGYGVKSGYFDHDLLRSYVQANAKELYRPDRYLGVWKDPSGMYWLDVSTLVEGKEDAIGIAKGNFQDAIWDNKQKDVIFVASYETDKLTQYEKPI